MKTRTKSVIAALLAAALLAATPGVGLAQTYFWFTAEDELGRPYTGQNVQCSVFRPNQHAAVTLHSSAALGVLGQVPIWSDVNGRLHFYSTSQDDVDVSCWYTYGGSGFAGRLSRFDHRIFIPRQGTQIVRFAVNSTAATYQSDSGVTLPAGALVRDVIIQNLNPKALGTYHLAVGFLGNHAAATADALVTAQALNAGEEWLRPHTTGAGIGSVSGAYLANHRGLLLATRHAGQTIERSYLITAPTGLTVSYSAQPGTSAAVRAHVFILFDRLHTAVNSLPFSSGTNRNP